LNAIGNALDLDDRNFAWPPEVTVVLSRFIIALEWTQPLAAVRPVAPGAGAALLCRNVLGGRQILCFMSFSRPQLRGQKGFPGIRQGGLQRTLLSFRIRKNNTTNNTFVNSYKIKGVGCKEVCILVSKGP
jgi:hypothetical protein